jgi:hypothetical protein
VTVRCDCHADWVGDRCEQADPSSQVMQPDNTYIYIIVGVIGGIILISAIVFLVWMKRTLNKRATSGTYSPSRQEMSGARVELANGLKIPPPERLI